MNLRSAVFLAAVSLNPFVGHGSGQLPAQVTDGSDGSARSEVDGLLGNVQDLPHLVLAWLKHFVLLLHFFVSLA